MIQTFVSQLSSLILIVIAVYFIVVQLIIKKYIYRIIAQYYPGVIEKIITATKGLHPSNRGEYEDESILKFESDERINVVDRKKIKTYRIVKSFMEVFIVVGILVVALYKLLYL